MLFLRDLATIVLAVGGLLGTTIASPTPSTSPNVAERQVWWTVDCASSSLFPIADRCDAYCDGRTLRYNSTSCRGENRRLLREYCGCRAECTPCDVKMKEAKAAKEAEEAKLIAEAKKDVGET